MKNTPETLNILNPDFRMPEHCGGDRWSILHGDSLQIIRQFEPNSFDAIITDPPYASGGSSQTTKNRSTNEKYSSILFIRGERPVVDYKYNLLKHPNIRYTEDGGAAPYDYTAADNALDDLPGAPENYELLDMDDFLPAEAAEMKPPIQRIRRPK